MTPEAVRQLIASRRGVAALPRARVPAFPRRSKAEAEGGCGVVGLACTVPVVGRHMLAPCGQMHNRGNGKGGGLAAAGLLAEQMGVDEHALRTDYLIQIALLEDSTRGRIVSEFIEPVLDVRAGYRIPTLDDYRTIEGLEVRPPDVWRYFARVKPDVLDRVIVEKHLTALDRQAAEDEFLSQWAFRLNTTFYADQRMRAFVISYGRDMLVLKLVGYAEHALRYYQMENIQARVWIGHQRYPTKGRVWHPGGAHPFTALDTALVHNGDFANYHAVSEYLAQRNLFPLFLTDTEGSVLLVDLWARIYGYPVEYVIEAMAPTAERDFLMLPPERQRAYRAIQTAHMHGSPDGPWFFIIARTIADSRSGGHAVTPSRPGVATTSLHNPIARRRDGATAWQLIGITDTSMLRPQVFALQEGAISAGIIASEKQAIDATLASLHHEDPRVCPVADRYWNARGGSYTDGGAFIFTVTADEKLICTDKFGNRVSTPPGQLHYVPTIPMAPAAPAGGAPSHARRGGAPPTPAADISDEAALFAQGRDGLLGWPYDILVAWLNAVHQEARAGDQVRKIVLGALTSLVDRRLPTGAKKRGSILALLHTAVYNTLRDVPLLESVRPHHATRDAASRMHRVGWAHRDRLGGPPAPDHTLVVDPDGFPSEGGQSLARELVRAYRAGWRSLIVFNVRGQRFMGSGFGSEAAGVRVDVYGSAGDYLGSGMDGIEMHVHNDAQDQVGQILKAGKLAVYGNAGQTLLYGAKGGEIYILGHAARRPLINAVGRPRVGINGTALDYLAESFMAGDPLEGGGFVVLNGIDFDVDGHIVDLDTPYAGSNLFSLASGGAIYVRDPFQRLDEEQLNGGHFADINETDPTTKPPPMQANGRLFNIPVDRLLTVDGHQRKPSDVYRKVEPVELSVLK